MADDRYKGIPSRMSDPAEDAFVVTPSDGTDIASAARGLYVGGTGNLTVVMESGSTVLLTAVPVGVLPIRVTRVKATGTTATNIVALV